MILGFKKQFEQPILKGIKKHTIREDCLNRWGAGRFIHMAIGVRTPNYKCFKESKCISVQVIRITYDKYNKPNVIVSGRTLNTIEVEQLAKNDGFPSTKEFYEWFNEDFHGKIIHWTKLKY